MGWWLPLARFTGGGNSATPIQLTPDEEKMIF